MGTIASQHYGSKRRLYVSTLAEATWGTAQARALVLNPLDGSPGIKTVKQILDNANSAQGQGMYATDFNVGATDCQGGYQLHGTPEAWGLLSTMALGDDTIATLGTAGYSHTVTESATGALIAHSFEEHWQGMADTTNGSLYGGVGVQDLSYTWGRGMDFSKIEMTGWACTRAASIDQTPGSGGIDDASHLPCVVFTPSVKTGLWLAPLTAFANAWNGGVGAESSLGVVDLSGTMTGSVNYSRYVQTATYKVMNNINLNDLYAAGSSVSTGFNRVGPAYVTNRVVELTVTLDLDDQSDEFLMAAINTTDADKKTWAMQWNTVLDFDVDTAGTVNAAGFGAGCHVMRLVDAKETDGLGPAQIACTFRMMGVTSPYLKHWSFDKVNKAYDATS